MDNLESQPWQPLPIGEVVDRFSNVDVDWWIAGGLAIDCFLGWQSRPHDDIDIEMFREDRVALFTVFSGWELFTVSAGELSPWSKGTELPPEVFGIWGRPSRTGEWAVEVILAGGDESAWRFRRDPEITLSRAELTATTHDGIRYCVPQVQLLYKAKQHRPKDDADMVRCLHRMTPEQLHWLDDALAIAEPVHPWRDLIAQRLTSRLN